ncbi:hypothetical protein BS50DRAFT_575518 [Corynespora cassiicola Philippines]|uniref:Uncharacterized protein n=1 Tax=Corynespora cassiicola Philippines TaxID=1448308 RepID=A0A2T2NJB9_CORCC|nr:hypothetical protein BS50DRAFT_575518 [Corynespora cassiicola Philippines]
MIAPSRQQSCASSQSTGTYRRAASLRTQDMHIPGSYPTSSDILTREAEDKLTRLPSISTSSYRSTPLSPNLSRRETPSRSSTPFSNGQQYRANVHPNSMSYPRQSISSPRNPAAFRAATPASSSAAPSSRQKPPKPAFEKFPVNQKPKVPVLPNFTSPSRSSATQSIDRFALEQGAYTTFKGRINDSNRTQVVDNEIERMHGMVPSNLFGHGLDPIGPSMRIHSPDGKPYSTLVEQIAQREILDGKRQKGSDRWHR